METQVYKHHFRHGHHHHKHNTFFALMAMLFFGLIALGVVASIYYTLVGHYITYEKFTNQDDGYLISYPSGMKLDSSVKDELAVGYPGKVWTYAIKTENNPELSLDQAFALVLEEMQPLPTSTYTANDIQTNDFTLDGKPAKQLSIVNYGRDGETVIVTKNNNNVYYIRGTARSNVPKEYNLINFIKKFQFVD